MYTDNDISIEKFFKSTVIDGQGRSAWDLGYGLKKPDSAIEVTEETTFKDMYNAQWAAYEKPKQSLFENKCIAECPEGYASVNGFCLECKSPCATCRGDISKC